MTAYGAVNTALYSRLAGDATLTAMLSGGTAVPSVYVESAPDNAVLPFVIFSHQSGTELSETAHRDPEELLYVRAYASTPSQAGSIDARLDTLLHLQPLTVSGWNNIWLARLTDISMIEEDPALIRTWSAGALYRSRLAN